MRDFEQNKDLYKIFIVFTVFCAFLGWLGFLLALAGWFYKSIFIFYLIFGLLAFGHWKIKFQKGKVKEIFSSDFFYANLALITIAIVFSLFTAPTVFSGRDQGSISEAAIRLSQNNHLEFSTPESAEFFRLYGPGKALNFPGFHYTNEGNLVTQFPLPYISWLAIFYSIFGFVGLTIANGILFYLFLASFYFLSRLYFSRTCSTVLILLTVTQFSFSWFLKFTLSENMALAFLWISILSLTLFVKKQEKLFYFSYLASAFLLIFTRIEGILFFIAGSIVLLVIPKTRAYLRKNLKIVLIPLLILLIVFLWNLSVNLPFYKEIGKALINNYSPSEIKSADPGSLSELLSIFSLYGLIGYLLVGLFGVSYFVWRKKWHLLIPLFIVLPSFIYLINPSISSDHPWMLRRFVFSVLPVLIFYSVFFLGYWKNKNHSSLRKFVAAFALVILFALSLPAFLKYFSFSENKNLLSQTTEIGQNFGDNDLVLVDRLVSGDPWTMISGPLSFLENKHSVYFFNSKDLEKIDTEKFENVYLVVPGEKPMSHDTVLQKYTNYSIATERLSVDEDYSILPERKIFTIEGTIFKVVK